MSIVNTLSLESNRQIKINFDGGDLSSDAGLLLIKEFISRLGIERILNRSFKTDDSAVFRYHTDRDNLLQMIYMIMSGYFEDDASDELTNDPVFKAVLEKSALASQPTVSRFFKAIPGDQPDTQKKDLQHPDASGRDPGSGFHAPRSIRQTGRQGI